MKPSARPRAESSRGGLDRLVLDVAGERVVEVELVAVELERRPCWTSRLVKSFLTSPGLGVGERDQRLLRPAQVERGLVPPHRLFEALDVAVDVAVEQREEQAEVLRVALVRRRRHQQVVVGHLRERLAELVGERLLVVGCRRSSCGPRPR